MAMTIVGFFFFVILLCLLACAENECVKPFIGFCLCGYDNIEKEKRRRRQMAVDRDNQRNEEMKEQNRMNQPQYNPTAPGHNTNHPQGYTPQPSGPPVMPNHPYNPAGPANDPYANAYPAQPLPQSQPQAVKNSNTANNAGGTENQDKKGLFGKAKDKFNKFIGNNS
uniref:Uncharacterized protein n=1 Tax=Euplotes crassus TaxID=5936 RepID=A0A7S3NQP5_EUPCR|mmetsp:Transcript_11297/g.11250  ORF Transcript_11297/g.11250 Transcript_11297/m.11250 type:complete len:167 (+) Transcript_11297:543-1043(+)